MTVAAIVLAAGGSSRLGEPKQLLQRVDGETLVHVAAREALEAGAGVVVVVVGAEAGAVGNAVGSLEVEIVCNREWQSGLASSIRTGVEHVIKDEAVTQLLMLTCDMPTVGVGHLRELILRANPESAAHSAGARVRSFLGDGVLPTATPKPSAAARVASSYGDTVGVPAIFDRSEFNELLTLTGDRGAKHLLMRADTILVALSHGTFDLDTPEDVRAWRESATSGAHSR